MIRHGSLFVSLIRTIFNNIGRCPKCMRQSFVFMLGAFSLAIVIELTVRSPALLIASRIVAVSSVGLWLSHLAAFSLRATRNAKSATPNAIGKNSETDLELQPRRQFLLTFARSFALVAAATALPVRSASAQAGCNCPDITPKCCYNSNGQTYVCAPADANCCGDPDPNVAPWSCPSGHYCTGDHGCT